MIMVLKCCVPTCRIQSDDPDGFSVSFHKLPAKENLREKWMTILKTHYNASIHQKYIYVCSEHFEKECFQYGALSKRRMLKSGSVPTIYSHVEEVKCSQQQSETSTSSVIKIQQQLRKNDEKIDSNNLNSQEVLDQNPPDKFENFENASKEQMIKKKEQTLRNKIEILRRQNRQLTMKLHRCKRKMYHFKFLFETLKKKK